MVGKQFDIVYDDFSGGHFVGPVGTKQPRNTFIGYDIAADPNDGCLMPLEQPYTITDPIAGASAATQSHPIWVDGTIVWGGVGFVYKLTVTSNPAAITTSGATGVTCLVGKYSAPAYFNASYVWVAGASILVVPEATFVPATTAPPVGMRQVVAWGEFVMGVGVDNNLWWCDPSNALVWSAGNHTEVGDPNTRFHLVVHQGNLYIGSTTGWWVATGIPGSTLTIRQLTTIDDVSNSMVSIDSSIVYLVSSTTNVPDGLPPFVRSAGVAMELAGTQTRVFNYCLSPEGTTPFPMARAVRVGHHVVLDNNAAVPDCWILNTWTGVWTRRRLTPRATNMGACVSGTCDWLFYRSGSPDTEQMWIAALGAPMQPQTHSGAIGTASADLAEYFHQTPFNIKEIICEIDYGVWNGTTTLDRSIGVKVRANGVPMEYEIDLSIAQSTSTQQTQVLPGVIETGNPQGRGIRSFVRFLPTDASTSYTAAPIVTLTGAKLRRLIMKCSEAL